MRWKDEADIDCETLKAQLNHNLEVLTNFVAQSSNELKNSRQEYLNALAELKELNEKHNELSVVCAKLRHMSKKNKERLEKIEQQKQSGQQQVCAWQDKISRLESQLSGQSVEVLDNQKILDIQEQKLQELEQKHLALEKKYQDGRKRLQQIDSRLAETLELLEKRSESWEEKKQINLEINSQIRSNIGSKIL